MRLCAIILILVTAQPAIADRLKGVVQKDRVGGSPVEGVQITSNGASPSLTGSDGQFVLDFPGMKAGDRVVLTVSKDEYGVVNDVQLEQKLPSNPDQDLFVIVICQSKALEKCRLDFYHLKPVDTISRDIQQRLGKAEREHRGDTKTISKLKQQIEEERARALTFTNEAAKQLSEDRASDLTRKAMELLLDGKVQDAITELSKRPLITCLPRYGSLGKSVRMEAFGGSGKYEFSLKLEEFPRGLSFKSGEITVAENAPLENMHGIAFVTDSDQHEDSCPFVLSIRFTIDKPTFGLTTNDASNPTATDIAQCLDKEHYAVVPKDGNTHLECPYCGKAADVTHKTIFSIVNNSDNQVIYRTELFPRDQLHQVCALLRGYWNEIHENSIELNKRVGSQRSDQMPPVRRPE